MTPAFLLLSHSKAFIYIHFYVHEDWPCLGLYLLIYLFSFFEDLTLVALPFVLVDLLLSGCIAGDIILHKHPVLRWIGALVQHVVTAQKLYALKEFRLILSAIQHMTNGVKNYVSTTVSKLSYNSNMQLIKITLGCFKKLQSQVRHLISL